MRSGSDVHPWGAEDSWQRVLNQALTPTASDLFAEFCATSLSNIDLFSFLKKMSDQRKQ